jgi:hypothetical protein
MERMKKRLWRDYVLNAGPSDKGTDIKDLSQELLERIREIKPRYYTEEGTVDYEALRDSKEFRHYKALASLLKDFDLELLRTREEKLAFWINIYNTIVVDGIITLGIKNSVKEIMGFFSKIKYLIGGHIFSADDIEHGILRGNRRAPSRPFRQFGPFDRRRHFSLKQPDPRIHFALVCGSRSCAPIRFYTPVGIDRELDMAAKNFINSSEVVIIPEKRKLLLSSIFKWYQKDFGGHKGVIDFIIRYTVDDQKKAFLLNNLKNLRVEYLYYDWNLNR